MFPNPNNPAKPNAILEIYKALEDRLTFLNRHNYDSPEFPASKGLSRRGSLVPGV